MRHNNFLKSKLPFILLLSYFTFSSVYLHYKRWHLKYIVLICYKIVKEYLKAQSRQIFLQISIKLIELLFFNFVWFNDFFISSYLDGREILFPITPFRLMHLEKNIQMGSMLQTKSALLNIPGGISFSRICINNLKDLPISIFSSLFVWISYLKQKPLEKK